MYNLQERRRHLDKSQRQLRGIYTNEGQEKVFDGVDSKPAII